MPDSSQVVFRFPDNARTKAVRQFVCVAGKHQILPDHQPQFIAQVVKILSGIDAASPDPDRVEMCFAAVFQQALRPFPETVIVLRPSRRTRSS